MCPKIQRYVCVFKPTEPTEQDSQKKPLASAMCLFMHGLMNSQTGYMRTCVCVHCIV